jgi:hypothetical protein
LIQAHDVIGLFCDTVLLRLIASSTPSKFSAPPILPLVQLGPPPTGEFSVPVLLFPLESVAEVPDPSSNFQCPTKPEEISALDTKGNKQEIIIIRVKRYLCILLRIDE